MVPEALDGLSDEERMRIYEMPRLEVRPDPEGYEVSGILRRDQTTGTHRFDSTRRTELLFCTLLTEEWYPADENKMDVSLEAEVRLMLGGQPSPTPRG